MLYSLDFTSQIYENTTNSLALFISTAFIVTIKKIYCNFRLYRTVLQNIILTKFQPSLLDLLLSYLKKTEQTR